MSGSKRPSTSSLRRFITSRPFVPLAELRRRFGLDESEEVVRIERDGQVAFVGLPEREAIKIEELWARDEIGLELSVEVRAPVVVGVYPLRLARFVLDQQAARNGHPNGNGHGFSNGHAPARAPFPAAQSASQPALRNGDRPAGPWRGGSEQRPHPPAQGFDAPGR